MGEEQRIAIVDLADELQVRKQRIFKILPRLSIRTSPRREPSRGNQSVATVSLVEAAAIRAELAGSASTTGNTADGLRDAVQEDVGVFYLIRLEPQHDPGRFKVGFTTEIEGRLRKHRCSAPFAQCLQTWPSRRTWERAAMDCATAGCEQLHTEVFRSNDIDAVRLRADSFFALMPALKDQAVEEDAVPEDQKPSY